MIDVLNLLPNFEVIAPKTAETELKTCICCVASECGHALAWRTKIDRSFLVRLIHSEDGIEVIFNDLQLFNS